MKECLDELCTCSLIEHSALSFLHTDNFKDISDFFDCKNVPSGETLWNEGDPCDYSAFIVSGKVEVKKETEFKGKQVVVGIYSKGAVVGALCALDNSPRAVTAVALEDVSLLIITRENFEKLIEKYPVLGVKLIKGMLFSVSKRLKASFDRLATFF
jgi:CRP-like cAMP-binding protein